MLGRDPQGMAGPPGVRAAWSAASLRRLPVRRRPDRPADRDAAGRDRPHCRRGSAHRADRPAALPARHRHLDRGRPDLRGRRLRAVQDRRAVHELRGAGPLGTLKRRGSPAGLDHQGRLRARPDGCSRNRRGTHAGDQPSATSSRAATATKTPQSSSARGAANSACTAAGSGWRDAASLSRRSSSPAPASSPGSSGRSPPTSRSGRPEPSPTSSVGWRAIPPEGEPSQHLRGTRLARATRDARPRQLPTDTSHAVSTRACQSDPPSLPPATRRSPHSAPPRAGP